MSKINAIRLINVNYNHNAISVNDEILHCNGLSTLMELDNGGGKSVLIQMITAPFVQKRFRNVKDRPFAGYFTTAQPSFILVEWALDGSDRHVLTGMMVRKNQNTDEKNDEELEIINFISEYDQPCNHDIYRLPVVEKSRDKKTLKTFAQCRLLFETLKKDRSVSFNYYDMNNSSQQKQYFEHLMDYRINYKEWQNIIRRVNEEESGLSKLFADCKNERGLIEKWFLETVENKLNRDSSRIQSFQDLMEKYIRLYLKNEGIIKRRGIIQVFDVQAQDLKERAEHFQAAVDGEDTGRQQIVWFLTRMRQLQQAAENESVAEQAVVQELEKQLANLEYSRFSAEYYQYQDQLAVASEQKKELEEQVAALSAVIEKCERKLHLLACAKAQEQLDRDAAALSEAEEKLAVCRQNNADMEPEREYLGYLIRCDLEEQLTEIAGRMEENVQSMKACEDQKADLQREQTLTEQTIRSLDKKEGSLNSEISTYDKWENDYNRKYKPAVSRNILGEYEPGLLEQTQEQLDGVLLTYKKNRKDSKQKLDTAEKELKEQRRKGEELRISQVQTKNDAAKAKKELTAYEDKIAGRKKILVYLGLKDDMLWNNQAVLETAAHKIEEIDLTIEQLLARQRKLKDTLSNLKTGKTLELSAEQKKMFDGLGISIVYGMEWMKKNDRTEEQNLELVRRHPFLPYALIMSEHDLDKLKKEEEGAFTSFPIPIVTRENLAREDAEEDLSTLDRMHVHFYMLFNNSLLNEEKLQQKIAELENRMAETGKALATAREESRQYAAWKEILRTQPLEQSRYSALQDQHAALENRIRKIAEDITLTSAEIERIDTERKALDTAIRQLEDRIKHLQNQTEELESLKKLYARYLEQRKELEECRTALQEKTRYQSALVRQLDETREQKDLLYRKQLNLEGQKEILQTRYSEFAMFESSEKPEQMAEEYSEDLAKAAARFKAITEKISGDLAFLEDACRQAERRKNASEKDLTRQAKRFAFLQEEWKSCRYEVYLEEQTEKEKKSAETELDVVRKNHTAAEKTVTGLEVKIANVCSRIEESCGMPAPMPRESLITADYKQTKNRLTAERADHRKEAEEKQKRASVYGGNADALQQYEGIPLKNPDLLKNPDQLKNPDLLKNSKLLQEDFASLPGMEISRCRNKLVRALEDSKTAVAQAREDLVRKLQYNLRLPSFQDDYFQKPLQLMLEVTDDPAKVLKQLEVTLQSYHDMIQKVLVDLEMVEDEKKHVMDQIERYIYEVHSQMGLIDRNSSITVRGRSRKMLEIGLPEWEPNQSLYHSRVEALTDDLTQKGLEMLRRGEAITEYIGKRVNTKELYDNVVGISNISIRLYKIEQQREIQITWSEVARNSGGEGFLSAFVILSSLLYYMRRDENDIFSKGNEGKVLIMDNPFAQTNASHLLIPLMDMAKKNNTQLICFTGLGGESIYNRFENIYVLKLQTSELNGIQYLRGTHQSGKERQEMTTAHIDVAEDGQMELLF